MSVVVKQLSFSFGDKPVLKDISMDVGDGEFLGLMGPNGSGKTTLLRCVTNYLHPAAGSISVDGQPLESLSPVDIARTFAVVPQVSATDFTFTAYDIVMMGRIPHIGSRLASASKADIAAVAKAMERTNTTQFADRQFSELSGGERQRVVVARAIAQEPRTLLLDEPTVYLDISGQIEIMDLIRTLNRSQGITVVAVLHDINLASRYCDRIALLSEGRLDAIGPPDAVLTPEAIQGVYGVEVSVRRDPMTNAVYVMPRSPVAPVHRHGTRVHVLCGGGTGGVLMRSLHERGFSVSAGVLNVLDSDFESAKDMHLPVIAEAPFAPISPENHELNLEMIRESDSVVASPFPVGPGNLKNLEAARIALRLRKRFYLIRSRPELAVDFVGGAAESIIKELISSGAVVVGSVDEALSAIEVAGGTR